MEQEIFHETLSYHAEKKSKLVIKEWNRMLSEQRITRAFGEVTWLRPSTKPNTVFKQLGNKPEIFGRLTQTRTMHGYNAFYFQQFNIDRDPHCPCGLLIQADEHRQIRDHIFNNCKAYNKERRILSQASCDYDPGILLGSIKGLLTMAKFLEESGAFSAEGKPYSVPKLPEIPELALNVDLSNHSTGN